MMLAWCFNGIPNSGSGDVAHSCLFLGLFFPLGCLFHLHDEAFNLVLYLVLSASFWREMNGD